jgi:probable HAF family extracellular repeat protein
MKTRIALCCSILVLLSNASLAQASTYRLIDLGSFDPSSINNSGQIVGSTNATATGQAALLSGGQTILLGSLGGNTRAYDINDAGQIVGTSYTSSGLQQAVIWNSTGTVTNLGDGIKTSAATSISESGVVGGSSNNYATVWIGTSSTNLNPVSSSYWWTGTGYIQLTAAHSGVTAISDNTIYISYAKNELGAAIVQTPTTTIGGKTYNIVYAGGDASLNAAVDANNAGQVAGLYMGYAPTTWSGANSKVFSTLPTLGAPASTSAINSSGVIVGEIGSYSFDGGHAAMWINGKLIDLNSYLSADEIAAGWVLESATDINDNGDIVGYASINGTGTFGFELTLSAIPEPSTWMMLLAGLGMLAVRARRQRTA